MAEVIFRSNAMVDIRWTVTRQPRQITDPMVVEFVKYGRSKLLNQTARWTPDGWDPHRWVPRVPTVPTAILLQVEAHMRKVA